jgi:DNA mismatch repair ATPase MutS
MGGKTVLFKTLAFLQLLTQSGFRIPATEFHTRVYSAIHILGTSPNNGIEGLSSFGQEIHQLTTAFESQESRLIFVDELAKTTNATEAKAILVAALNTRWTKPK